LASAEWETSMLPIRRKSKRTKWEEKENTGKLEKNASSRREPSGDRVLKNKSV